MKTSLERAFDEAVGLYVEPCSVCGGPSKDANYMIPLGRLEEVPACPMCGHAVNHEGRTLCRINSEGGIMPVIILRSMECSVNR